MFLWWVAPGCRVVSLHACLRSLFFFFFFRLVLFRSLCPPVCESCVRAPAAVASSYIRECRQPTRPHTCLPRRHGHRRVCAPRVSLSHLPWDEPHLGCFLQYLFVEGFPAMSLRVFIGCRGVRVSAPDPRSTPSGGVPVLAAGSHAAAFLCQRLGPCRREKEDNPFCRALTPR